MANAQPGKSMWRFVKRRSVDLHFCPSQVKLFNEKRSDLEEQQLHLNVGLQKIRETVDQVSAKVSFLTICNVWRLLL